MANSTKGQKIKPWTVKEEKILIDNVRKNVSCLKKAFEQTSKEIQRSPKSISQHWYKYTSKKSAHTLFLTCSGKHVSRNRKNGKGDPCKLSLFKKVLILFGLSY